MLTDMENDEQDKSFDSSRTRRQAGRSDKSRKNLRKNSKTAPARETGETAEPTLSSLDFMLGVLQSDLGEYRDFGGTVRLADDPNGLIIQLPNVAICHSHKMMHFGQKCPMC
jgi:hypothetical protein